MKLIITATAPELEAQVDPRFGRGAYFIVVDTETLGWQAHYNQAVNAAGGAGTRPGGWLSSRQTVAVGKACSAVELLSLAWAAGRGKNCHGHAQRAAGG